MKRTITQITAALAPMCMLTLAVLASCQKTEIQPLSISLTIPSEGISIQQGETVEIPYILNNTPEGGEIEVSASSDNKEFIVTSESDDTNTSGTISVQAPDVIYTPSTFNVSITATVANTGETANANFTVSAVMYEGYIEISEAANCHIVKPGAFVRFPANIGNTSEKVSFTAAELLWQDTMNLVTSVTADPENAAVYAVLSPEVSGNAVIALKNADGTITWSYHLWVTDFDPDTEAADWTSSSSSRTYKIMDRHIGALTADPQSEYSNGLFYQWGRKDPFVSSNHEGDLRPIYDISGNTVEKIIEPCNASDNVTVSIAHPLTHYSGVSGGDYSWITNDPSFMASDTVKDLWGGNSEEKSKYDPCPAGWQVMPSDAFGFMNEEDATKEKVYNASAEEPSNADMLGWMINYGSSKLYFPSQGEVQHGGNYVNGIGSTWPCGKVWSATLDENIRCLAVNSSPSNIYPDSSMPLGYELPVRCVKIK